MSPRPWRIALLTWIPLTPLVYLAGHLNTTTSLGDLPPLPRAAATAAAIVIVLQRLIMPPLLNAARPWTQRPAPNR